jgi:hypothetical protein
MIPRSGGAGRFSERPAGPFLRESIDMRNELEVITHTYDLLLWTLKHTAKFPRSHRHGLGQRIEDKTHRLLECLVEAKFSSEKSELLRQASLRVEELRLLFRITRDIRILSIGSQGFASQKLDQIGRQIGGWRRGSRGP